MPMPSSDKRRYASAHRVAIDAGLLAAALMLAYLEHLIPFGTFLIPGLKPGFANIVTVLAFSMLSPIDALTVSLLRVCITGVLFGSWTSFLFSFSGACLAFLALLLARALLRRCSYIGVSVLCAAAHNLGQALAVAGLMLLPSGNAGSMLVAAWLLPFLFPFAILCGTLTGLILNLLVPRLERSLRTWKNA